MYLTKDDFYTKEARKEGFRSRSALKLYYILTKHPFLHHNDSILDIGSHPGGWLQVVRKKTKEAVFGVDLCQIKPIPQVQFMKGDITDLCFQQQCLEKIQAVNIVLSDASVNLTGIAATDQERNYALWLNIFELTQQLLKPKGVFLIKLFYGKHFTSFVSLLKSKFAQCTICKPAPSLSRSSETYLLCKQYKS